MAKLGGDPSLSAVELTVQNTYFAFQVVQVFLVATLGSAASSAAGQIIADPTNVPSMLASSIPTASNFYLSYIILQGLGVVSSQLLGLSGLVVFIVLGKLLDKTPRKMYKRWISLSSVGWGTVFPVYTNLFVIGTFCILQYSLRCRPLIFTQRFVMPVLHPWSFYSPQSASTCSTWPTVTTSSS